MPDPNDHDEKCGCGKQLAAAVVAKAAHADRNTGAREPAAPAGRKIDVTGLTAVPADMSHLIPRHIRDGGQALQYLRDLAAGQASGGGTGGLGGGNAAGGELGVTFSATPSQYGHAPGLAAYDAGRGGGYVPQCNGPRGGKR
jgi:hypothetical protein